MPRDISDSTGRKKDKLSSGGNLLRDCRKVYDADDEYSKRKLSGKCSADDSKSSKKGGASGYSSGRKRQYSDRDVNCFASEYDDFDDSQKQMHGSMPVKHQHSRNGLVLPGISHKHSLVDYDDESSDSESSSESFPPQYPTGKAVRRKSAVQVVSASVKADMNDIRQQSHKSDTTAVRRVHVSSSSAKKQSSTDSPDETGDKKKYRHVPDELSQPVTKTNDIPVKSSKRRRSKDHRGSRKCDDKEYDLTSEQIGLNNKKLNVVDRPEKTSTVKASSKEKVTKQAKRRNSETEVVVRTEKSKVPKKSKKHELCEEQWSDDEGLEQGSRTNVEKLPPTDAVHKKEKSKKVLEDSFSRSNSKTTDKTDKQKKVGSKSDSINGTKSLSRGISSAHQDDLVVKHNSDDHVHVRKKHEKEKHSSKKKSRAAENADSDDEMEKKARSALKGDSKSASGKSDKTKDKRNKDKQHHSRNEREFSDEGQISSDSSSGRAKESKHKRRSHAALRNGSDTPVRSFQNASASSKKAASSELCHTER